MVDQRVYTAQSTHLRRRTGPRLTRSGTDSEAGTHWPERFLRAEDGIEVLGIGRYVDVIAIRGDPLTDMRAARRRNGIQRR